MRTRHSRNRQTTTPRNNPVSRSIDPSGPDGLASRYWIWLSGTPRTASTSRIRGDNPLVHGPLGSKLLIVHHGVTHLESVQVGAILIAGEPIPAGPDGGQNHGPGAGEGVQHHAGA